MTNTERIGAPPSPARRTLALTIGAAVALAVAYRRQKVREQENDRAKRAEQRENTKLQAAAIRRVGAVAVGPASTGIAEEHLTALWLARALGRR